MKKLENQRLLVFDWIASKKNDIAADHLAFLLGQFPDDPDLDIFADSEGRKKAVLDFIKSNYHKYEVKILIFLFKYEVNNDFYNNRTVF